MRLVRACVVGVSVLAIALVIQCRFPDYFETPLVALVGSLLYTSDLLAVKWVAWPVITLAYMCPSIVCGLLAALMFLLGDALRLRRSRAS